MEFNTGYIDKNNNVNNLKITLMNRYAKLRVEKYLNDDITGDRKISFEEFKKDYSIFSPYFDYLLFEMKYKVINPFFNNNRLGFGYNDVIEVSDGSSRIAIRDENYRYSKSDDRSLKVSKFNSSELKESLISNTGLSFAIGRKEKINHDSVFAVLLFNLINEDSNIFDNFKEYINQHPEKTINSYFRDCLGFLQVAFIDENKTEGYLIANKNAISDFGIIEEIKKMYPNISVELGDELVDQKDEKIKESVANILNRFNKDKIL